MTIKPIEPKDILAAICLIGGFYLLSKGIDAVVGGVVIMVSTYYFRKRIEAPSEKKE